MTNPFNYDVFVTRNSGYVNEETQARIRNTSLLIAGCGIGSSVAVCAARFGFEKFVLIDGDVVDPHNLNRQFYEFADIGNTKVAALKNQILRINPAAQVEAIAEYLTADNTDAIVSKADIVFDTVDFLDLTAILNLHTSAKKHGATIMTALSIGYGAGVCLFPAGSGRSLADLVAHDVELAADAGGEAPGYAQIFANIIARIGRHLDVEVVEQIAKALTIMADGKPCPASQVAVGSFTLGALAVSMMHDFLDGRAVPAAPNMVIHSFRNHTTKLVDLAG